MPRASAFPAANSDLSDLELVDLVLAATPGAFEQFYRRHGQLIYHCVRKRADAQDVDDICHAFFERLMTRDYRVLQLWQRGTSLPIYLSKVMRNFVIDFHRARHRREEAVGGTAELDVLSRPGEEGITARAILKELRHLGIQAWAMLEVRDRRLLCDRLHRDRSNEDIAIRAQLSAGALRTAISRAQARLLTKLSRLAPEFFPDRL